MSLSLLIVGLSALVGQFLHAVDDSIPSLSVVYECDEDVGDEEQLEGQTALVARIAYAEHDSQFYFVEIRNLSKVEDGRPSRFQSRGPPAMLL